MERFFRDLTENRLRRGVFRSIEELITAIFDYIDDQNENLKPLHLDRRGRQHTEKVEHRRCPS